ncbi:MAG TPA: endopeptidase La [Spirochaetia bacterium]|nr:endopeptidase La [Spirochaetia bacterium]
MSDHPVVPADQILPARLFLIPLHGKPIFPGILTPLMLPSAAETDTVEKAIAADSFIGLVLTKSEEAENPGPDDLFTIGTAAKIVRRINLPDGGVNIFISTLKRFQIKRVLQSASPLSVVVQYVEDENVDSAEVKALTRALISEMKQVSENNPLFSEEMRLSMVNIDHPGKIADFITSILNIDRAEQQRILEMTNVQERMEHVLIFIKKEQELLKIQKKIQEQLSEKISKSQREYFLKEEMKAIKAELGMAVDAKTSEYNRFKEAVEKLGLQGEVKEQVEQELEKFSLLDANSPEFTVSRNYLETIIALPWNDDSRETIDMEKAREILDADHYGLEDVKERIIEYLAVRKLKEDSKGSIICLVGPPGVGKTSVGKSIARALQRKFFRFSVGGMRDEAEIKGHRRTYIGAMPGKIIQGLKIVKTRNPVYMIDEIDKLGASFQGDPSSALLEVLDPEQNVAFRDHYLDLPFDISHILFITTANTLDTIPAPLLDRMEVIRLSGYIDSEKTAIARKYLIPKSLDAAGLAKGSVKYDNAALLAIADGYAREAGLRNFEKALDKVHRKIARKSILGELTLPVSIKKETLAEYLGKPVFLDEEMAEITKPGMAIGLAWTPLGGAVLAIEAVANPGKEGFKLTGKLGEVMQESASIAYSYVRHISAGQGVEPDFWEKNLIHLHVPAGATPKDGPSAGITLASALLSLASGKRLRKSLAMTGELSLVGRVLPIGGLKEKVIAARRNRIKQVVFPAQNQRDLDEIPEHIREGITFHPVSTMEEVIEKVF